MRLCGCCASLVHIFVSHFSLIRSHLFDVMTVSIFTTNFKQYVASGCDSVRLYAVFSHQCIYLVFFFILSCLSFRSYCPICTHNNWNLRQIRPLLCANVCSSILTRVLVRCIQLQNGRKPHYTNINLCCSFDILRARVYFIRCRVYGFTFAFVCPMESFQRRERNKKKTTKQKKETKNDEW